MIKGTVARVSGPVLRLEGLGQAGLYDVVEVGPRRLVGEIIRLEGTEAVAQIYEDENGLRLGDEARSTGRPLSVRLGPGLIGTIYDGIQRPLDRLYRESGAFLQPGARGEPLDPSRRWPFVPDAGLLAGLESAQGVRLRTGLILGTVRESELVTCKIMAPPDFNSAELASLAPEGDYTVDDVIARTRDGRELGLAHWWPVRVPRPYAKKLAPDEPLVTGQRVIDVFFPLSKGGTAAIPGGFGTGKTMTQHAVAKWCDADVIVYIGCGERGNEMTDVLTEFPRLVDPRSGRSLMERTILIANTSNMPVAAREVSIYTGVTLAEFYRDMGYHVAIMADSTSRWAEALRELSGRMEEMPAEEGFPAYLPTRLAEFYERAGRVETCSGPLGSVSIIGAVSPPGGDFSEPVTQHTRRFIRCFWALDRELANARHYPAISWIESYSEYAEEIRAWWDRIDPLWPEARRSALDLLKKEQRLAEIVRLIGPDALPDDQRLVLLAADLVKNGFLQQNSFDKADMFCEPAKQVRLLALIMGFYARALECLRLGAPLLKVSSLPIRERLARLKSEAANGDLAPLDDAGRQLASEFEELERFYRVKERP